MSSIAAAAVALAVALPAADGGAITRDRVLLDSRITESSGLAASNRHPGVLWTHNDSGSRPRIYAVGPDGRTRADYLLDVASPRDWEAMAASVDGDGRAWLWVGDIGDNSSTRQNGILVHRVAEPATLRSGTLQATSYRLRYPDAPRDAEALLVHPETGRLYIVTKGVFGGVIYRAPANLRSDAPNVLERVGTVESVVTDGVFLRDGRAALLSYSDVTLLSSLDDDATTRTVPVESPQGGTLQQSESVALDPSDPSGDAVLVGTEGSRSPVLRVPVPPAEQPSAARRLVEDAAEAAGAAVERVAPVPPLVLGAAALLLGVVVAAAVGARRRQKRGGA